MKTSTILRICGAAIILMILAIIGTYNFTVPGVAIAVFGFPVLFELLIVRPMIVRENSDVARESQSRQEDPSLVSDSAVTMQEKKPKEPWYVTIVPLIPGIVLVKFAGPLAAIVLLGTYYLLKSKLGALRAGLVAVIAATFAVVGVTYALTENWNPRLIEATKLAIWNPLPVTPTPLLESFQVSPAPTPTVDEFLESATTQPEIATKPSAPATQVIPPSPAPQVRSPGAVHKQTLIPDQAQIDLENAAQQAVIDYPFLDTPEGAEALRKIMERRDAMIAAGTYPAIALRRAVNAVAPGYADRLGHK